MAKNGDMDINAMNSATGDPKSEGMSDEWWVTDHEGNMYQIEKGEMWQEDEYGTMCQVGKGKSYWNKGQGKGGKSTWQSNSWKGKGQSDGKGKGKGFKGSCYNCGEIGHPARLCPTQGHVERRPTYQATSYGKGSGNYTPYQSNSFSGNCHTCGTKGHKASQCQKGKGYGKSQSSSDSGKGWKGSQGGWNNEISSSSSEWQGGEIGILSFGGSLMSLTMPNKTKWQTPVDGISTEQKDDSETTETYLGPINQFEMNGGVNMQEWEKSWDLIKVNVDSGAIDNVCNKEIGKEFAVKETKMSKGKGYYMSASKHKIYNEGEKTIVGQNDMGLPAGMTFQVCDVKGPLGSVRRICEAGNRVVFDDYESFVENKTTGTRTPIEKVGGVYYLNLWVKKAETGIHAMTNCDTGFHWQGE
jgi:hypothetical protein